MSTTPKRDCDAAFDRMHAERDEARAYYLRCAQAIGVVYEADGINPHPGPIEEVEHHIREAARKSGDLAEARAEVERMRAVVDAVRRWGISRQTKNETTSALATAEGAYPEPSDIDEIAAKCNAAWAEHTAAWNALRATADAIALTSRGEEG